MDSTGFGVSEPPVKSVPHSSVVHKMNRLDPTFCFFLFWLSHFGFLCEISRSTVTTVQGTTSRSPNGLGIHPSHRRKASPGLLPIPKVSIHALNRRWAMRWTKSPERNVWEHWLFHQSLKVPCRGRLKPCWGPSHPPEASNAFLVGFSWVFLFFH